MKWMKQLGFIIVFVVLLMCTVQTFAASRGTDTKSNEEIKEGVYIGDVDVSNLTYKEAEEAIQKKVKEATGVKVS